jgi:hypothetical protein
VNYFGYVLIVIGMLIVLSGASLFHGLGPRRLRRRHKSSPPIGRFCPFCKSPDKALVTAELPPPHSGLFYCFSCDRGGTMAELEAATAEALGDAP